MIYLVTVALNLVSFCLGALYFKFKVGEGGINYRTDPLIHHYEEALLLAENTIEGTLKQQRKRGYPTPSEWESLVSDSYRTMLIISERYE